MNVKNKNVIFKNEDDKKILVELKTVLRCTELVCNYRQTDWDFGLSLLRHSHVFPLHFPKKTRSVLRFAKMQKSTIKTQINRFDLYSSVHLLNVKNANF